MNLNHINLPVENVKKSKEFFEHYFGFKCVEVKGDHIIAIMDKDGLSLVLMSHVFNLNDIATYPSSFHIGFLTDTREEVTEQYNKLKDGGIYLKNEPCTMRGVYGFYFMAPGDILIEVSSKN